MKKALLALGIGAVSFLVGLLGFVFVLPSVAPQRAEDARLYLDSLEAARLGYLPLDSASYAGAGHTNNGQALDTLQTETGAAASPTQAPDENALPANTALNDSLTSLRQRVQALQSENRSLQHRLDEARKSAQPGPALASDVAGLTETLAKLDDKELRPILQQLESDVLEQLYKNTSGRTQARLLQAMPSDRAALFVQSLVRGTDVPPAATREAGGSTPGKSAQ